MGAVTTCQSSCCDAGFLVDKHFILSNPGIRRCPSDSGIVYPRGKDLNLDGDASWMFWVSISFNIQAGVFLGFATLKKIPTVGFWEIETTVFDPASVFLSTH